MKPLLGVISFVLLSAACYAQGYINTFNAFAPTPGGSLAYLRDCGGPLLSKAVGRVEILLLDGTILSPVKDGTGNRLAVDGLFSLGVTAIPGSTPGQPASIILRAWDSSTGSTYATAIQRSERSITFVSVGTATSPSNFVTGSNFTGLEFECCPEPSAIALTAAGIVGFLFVLRRRKRPTG